MTDTETTALLNSVPFRRAVARIQLRAEKQTDLDRVTNVFVKSDLRDRVESPDNQLVLGRRGTGKTHLLRVFQKDSLDHGEPAFYFDFTRLGSGISGLDLSPKVIAQKYFIAFLNHLGSELLEHVARMELPEGDRQETVFGRLVDGLNPGSDSGKPLNLDFDYANITASTERVLGALGIARLFVIIDEWATVPFEAQPYLGEYLKRGLLSVPAISAKILAVNYQCQFYKREGGNSIGLARGADMPAVIDMDRYLVFDEQRDFVRGFFAQLLFNHLGVELGWDLELTEAQKQKQVEALFTQDRAFVELVRAAEGNCRDFLCIFSRAYFDEYRHSGTSKLISIPNVVSAARSWFDAEKACNVYAEPESAKTLSFLVERVLKGYKSRTFLVEDNKVDHPRLTRLLNERVLHRLGGTYSHQDKPGVRYCLLTVDYGAFVKLRGTVYQVDEEVWRDTNGLKDEERETAVPVDDTRSIRRIVFDPNSMDVAVDRQLRFNWQP